MSRKLARTAAIAVGAVMLSGVASMAVADDEVGSKGVDIGVDIQDEVQGVLAMTVAGDSVTLLENGSDNTARVFTGTLPTVRVTDTRYPDQVPEDAFWYVVGTVSDFTSGTDTIDAENLGWAPHLIDGGDSGLVSEGDAVDPAMDNGPGLVDQELLAMAFDSATVRPEGEWTADAALTLKTPVTVNPGLYTATLTLSLFE